MVKRKVSALLVMFMMLLQCNYGFGFLTQASAAAIPDNIIDSVTMSVYDSAGHPVTDTVYDQNSRVKLDYNWSLPDGHGYHAGDEFTFTLPQAFLLYNDIHGPLVSGDENVGTFSADHTTHQVVITFNDFIESHFNIHGTLSFNTQFDVSHMTGSTTQTVSIPIRSGEQVFTLHFRPDVSSTIEKSGTAAGFNAQNINWTVDVNKALDTVENAVVTDSIPAGLGVPVTVSVYDLNVNLDGTVSQGAPVDSSKYTVHTDGNVLKVNFTDSPIHSAYRIQYTTPINGSANGNSYTNTAAFEGSNLPSVEASATVEVQRGGPLSKSVIKYDPIAQTIDWAIKYNYDGQSIAQSDASVTDLFDDELALVPGSVHVFPVTLDSSGKEILGHEATGQFTVTPVTATGKNGFKVQFNSGITSAYQIVYRTKAVDRVINDTTVRNDVTVGSGASYSVTHRLTQSVLAKGVGAIDYQAKTVSWKIDLNKDKQPMSNVVVTDRFYHKGLQLVPGSLLIKQGSTALVEGTDYTVDSAVSGDAGFKVTFTHPLSAAVSIYYTTKFNYDGIDPASGTSNFDNLTTVTWTDVYGSSQTKTVYNSFVPRSEVKNNGFKSGSYNAISKELSWNIGINYNGKTLENAVLVDPLESGQQLVPVSLAVYNMTIPANGNAIPGTVVDDTYYHYSVDNSNTLRVIFDKPISSPYFVKFKTSLAGQLIDSTVTNTAKLFDGSDQVSKNLMAYVTIPHGGEYVNKTGVQSGDKINWTVNINSSQSTVNDAKLTDTPTDNQILLPDSFHLYATTVAANGSLAKGVELTKDTDYTLDIQTDNSGKQSFELSFLHPITSAYILEYQSMITAKNYDTVSNTASLSGNNVTTVTKETTTDVVVGVSSGSGTGSGERGSLTIKKVDADDDTVLLSGATFELYKKSGDDLTLLNTLTTDSTGSIVFNNLPAGDYVVRETAAPAGYQLDDSDHAVTINSTAGVELDIPNNPMTTPPGGPTNPPGGPTNPPGGPTNPPGGPTTPPGGPTTPPGGPTNPPGGPTTPPGGPTTPPGGPTTPPGNPTTPPIITGTPPTVPTAPPVKPVTPPVKPVTPPSGQGTTIDGDSGVPLGGISGKPPQGTDELPKTGETSHLPVQAAGLAAVLLGIVLWRKKWFAKG
ncbi:LPXTG cell wall anchor domain-containing protein [Paenibacillus humicola]|uniref:LPXTG cell wall anchor domain-containing protein n=1 Tax=Paenibacillus humicola TaxID=3110540 RepID=UPI00237A2F38|nr:LPXTG cell wall anchor domain-containing protein [Paenibacillus humicola]